MIVPCIDIMGAKVVQLVQGKKKVFESDDFESIINDFKLFPQVNIIDLDAVMGKGNNKDLIKKLCQELRCNVGGGIRDIDTATEYLRAGAQKIIIATKASPEFLSKLPKHRIIVAIDLKKGRLATHAWTQTQNIELKEKLRELEAYCDSFLVTHIENEGTMKGSNIEFFKKIATQTSNKILAAGGIASHQDIRALSELGTHPVIGMAYYQKKILLDEAIIHSLHFKEKLIPTIVQDESGQVLMLAYSSAESIKHSMSSKQATYFSRSRNDLWTKGETSGNTQELLKIQSDCDQDALIYTVKQKGVACHTQTYSCFGSQNFSQNLLFDCLQDRIEQGGSYTAQITSHPEKLHKKIIEEAFEVTQANSRQEKIWELADLHYFMLAFMAKHQIKPDEVTQELSRRHL